MQMQSRILKDLVVFKYIHRMHSYSTLSLDADVSKVCTSDFANMSYWCVVV